MKLSKMTAAGALLPVLFAGAAAAQMTAYAPVQSVRVTIPLVGFVPCPLNRDVTPMLPVPMSGRFSIIPVLPGTPIMTPRREMPVMPLSPLPKALRSPMLAAAAVAYVPAKNVSPAKDAIGARAKLDEMFDGVLPVEPARGVVTPERRIGLPEQDLEKEIGAY